jgi:hypothetical protein
MAYEANSTPTEYFLCGQELKMGFIFFNVWEKIKELYFVTNENYINFKFLCPQSFISTQLYSYMLSMISFWLW